MIRLVVAELRRLAYRRLTWVAAALLLLGVGLFQIAVVFEVSPPTAAEVAENQQYLEEARQDWRENHEQYERECLDQGLSADQCAYPEPTAEDYGLAPTPFAEMATIGVTLSAFLTLLAGYLVAASSIGAEYTTGAIANWLTFVPQRLRVFTAKLVAVVLASAALGALVNFTMLGLVALISRIYDNPLVGSAAPLAIGGRAVAVAVLAAILGFCIALVTRHTVAALGLVLGYLVVAFILRGLAQSIAALSNVPRWMPDYNVLSLIQKGTSYYVNVETSTPEGVQTTQVERTIAFGDSVLYWVVVLVVLVVGSALLFRRRDVT